MKYKVRNMIPLILISPNEYFTVPPVLLQFMYPIIFNLQPLCEDGNTPVQVNSNIDFLMAIQSVECNCGSRECKLSRARDDAYDFANRNGGKVLLLVQATEIVNEEVVFRIAECMNGDDENGIPPMSVVDAAYIYQQADMFKRHTETVKRIEEELKKAGRKKPTKRKPK